MDEVVAEVRRIRDDLVAEHGYNLNALCKWLRQRENESRGRFVDVETSEEKKEDASYLV